MDAKKIDIKNKALFLPAKIINLLDFNPEKLEINREETDEIDIYYISYDAGPFYLTIDNMCRYFKENNRGKYLNLFFL